MKYLMLVLLLSSCITTVPDAPRLEVKPVVAKHLRCPMPVIKNVSGRPFTQFDAKVLENAKKRCAVLFQESPCVAKFYMYNDDGYGVMCGGER